MIYIFCMLVLYVYILWIFVLHNIVFNALTDNKNSCYKELLVMCNSKVVQIGKYESCVVNKNVFIWAHGVAQEGKKTALVYSM